MVNARAPGASTMVGADPQEPSAARPPGQNRRPQAVPTIQCLLRLMTWLSPAFPTGAFAYSHGLEWAVDSRDISNEATLTAWLGDLLFLGTARTDTILLRHAHRAADSPSALGEIA